MAGSAKGESHEQPSWAKNKRAPPSDLRAITQKAIDVYLMSKQPNGEMGGIGWWQSANGYTAMALHDIYAHSKHNYNALACAIKACEARTPGLINEYNDDTLWWGLLCVHVYTIDEDSWFLDKAKWIWNHVRFSNSICRRGCFRFQGMDMEGACYWTTNSGEEQLNAITTGLFAELSVRLALLDVKAPRHYLKLWQDKSHVSTDQYVEHARCSLGWILRCRYRKQDEIVLDNILIQKQQARDWTFTYNTGVAIGVCALLYDATHEAEYLSLACAMAHQAMRRSSWVEDNGVLTEHGAYGKGNHQPSQNSDAVGFKAVLMRHLATLHLVVAKHSGAGSQAQETAELIKSFININFWSQQERNTNGRGQYGPWWNGPCEMATSHSQMAVLDVMAAAVLVNPG